MKINKLLSAIALLSSVLSGCGTSIPPEQYASYAFLVSGVSDSRYPCEPGTPSCSVFIGYIDQHVQTPAAPKFVVKPGAHIVELKVHPFTQIYRFVALGGHRYILTKDKILVSMRSDSSQHVIDELVPYDGQYITENEAKERVQAAHDAFRAKQTNDMPRIRRIGAEVCLNSQTGNGTMGEHGYVEGVTDDKIKIRVSSGMQGDHVIWDLPDLWVLCGHN
ncbi:hypothetical protein [Paraburkholderia bannensis]|uniref:hypothetical protein n=1 Tax=Paraburkholderia bannensis TaxID=765414 RepID=UPI002AB7D295|nr:hypothetical protein [Paraburkholderia bannensis]